jgi:hypothetical protein
MEKPANRMLPAQQKRADPQIVDAPPVVIAGRVMPCICPACGKGMAPVVKQTLADKGMARVECSSCKRKLVYYYATKDNPMPRVRESRGIESMP